MPTNGGLSATCGSTPITVATAAAGLAASGKGKRLQVTGQFHLGTKVLQFALHHLEADGSGGSGVAHDPKKLAVIYAGLDGSIGTWGMTSPPRNGRLGQDSNRGKTDHL